MVTETKRAFRVIGTRPVRPDGIDKVTGRAQYGADVHVQGALQARMVRSPHAHAVIRRIDASRALALDGVKAVVTSQDLAGQDGDVAKLQEAAQNILAGAKAFYRGQAVAAVAAVSDHIAQKAARLVDVEYEVLPHVLDVREAMRPEAPVLHEAMRTRGPDASDGPTNIVAHHVVVFGDAEKGFAECDVIVEDEFSTKMVHQGYIEPQAATASWAPDGQLTIWTTTQGSFPAREACAQLLGHPISKIKVIPTEIGGGFGGKISVYLEPVVALLSRKTGRPVTMRMDRADVFEGTGPTPGTSIRVKLGATKDGRLRAMSSDMAYENGAFPGTAAMYATMVATASYDIEHVRIEGWDVVVNKPRTQDYRAPSAPAAAFAVEQMVDELSLRLNIDPLQLRLTNAAK